MKFLKNLKEIFKKTDKSEETIPYISEKQVTGEKTNQILPDEPDVHQKKRAERRRFQDYQRSIEELKMNEQRAERKRLEKIKAEELRKIKEIPPKERKIVEKERQNIIKCPKCRTNIPIGHIYCKKCGEKLHEIVKRREPF
jgi:hypothetical protein